MNLYALLGYLLKMGKWAQEFKMYKYRQHSVWFVARNHYSLKKQYNAIKGKTSMTQLYGSETQGRQHKHNSELNNPLYSDITEFQLQSAVAGMTDDKR